MVRIAAFLLLGVTSLCAATPAIAACYDENENDGFPFTHNSTGTARDPSIVKHGDFYYMFRSGAHIPFYKSRGLDGPWEDMGTVLDEPSVIPKENSSHPWAPSVLYKDGLFYCYYSISVASKQNSAIGVATSEDVESNSWEDHGAIIQSGTGPGSDVLPFNKSNAIDAHVFIDPKDDTPYMIYGSYWTGLYSVALKDDLLALPKPMDPDFTHLASIKPKEEQGNDIEGAFMTYREPWYYLWLSRGKCCRFKEDNLPKPGEEYSIRVTRSQNVRGPFVGKDGEKALKGGGHIVYGSNHNNKIYAPGGQGVLTDGSTDILYYHFLNTSIGLTHRDAYMGWTYLKYVDGWPVATFNRDGEPG